MLVFSVGVIETDKPVMSVQVLVVADEKVVVKVVDNTCAILLAPPLAMNTAALAEIKVRVPPAFCDKAKLPVVPTVQVPAVTVQTPAPMFRISTLSEAPKIDVFTVMVVADAEFITTLVPRSAIVRV